MERTSCCPYQASVGSTALQTPRTPCGPATPHPCWQQAAKPSQSCCVGCLRAQSSPCLVASPGRWWTSAPTAHALLPLPKGPSSPPATCLDARATHQQDAAIAPTKNRLPIMLVKKQVLQPPCWSLCGWSITAKTFLIQRLQKSQWAVFRGMGLDCKCSCRRLVTNKELIYVLEETLRSLPSRANLIGFQYIFF